MEKSLLEDSKSYMSEKCHIFGRNLRTVRKHSGMSAFMLGNFLNLSTAYIGLIERGKRTPSLETFLKICDFFGGSYKDMLTDNSASTILPPKSKEKTVESKLLRKQKIVNGMITTFDKAELNCLIGIIKNFKSLSEYKRNDEKY